MPQALDTVIGSERAQPYPNEYLQEMLRVFKPFMRHTTVDNVTPVACTSRTDRVTSRSRSTRWAAATSAASSSAWPPAVRTRPHAARGEEVVDHLPEASDLTGFEIIDSATKELRFMAQQLGGARA